MNRKKLIAVILAVLAFAAPLLFPMGDLSLPGRLTLSILLSAAVLWFLEPVPVYTTSLLVILLQVFLLSREGFFMRLFAHVSPGFEPLSYRVYLSAFADPIIILFLGGCLLAEAAVHYRLDRWLAGLLLRPTAGSTPGLVLGLMLTTAVLSAFMSNTATTAMMMTLVLPLLPRIPEDDPLRIAVVLAVPIGANIGGILTPIGTPPNAIALSTLAQNGATVSFTSWVLIALPLVGLTLGLSWMILCLFYPSKERYLRLTLDEPLDRSPKALLFYLIFGLTVTLWATEALHGMKSSMVAFIPVTLLPLLGIVEKRAIRNLPWDVFWLMAGGISLGMAIKNSGLADWLVAQVAWDRMSGFVLLGTLCGLCFLMANFLSHTVTVTILAPIAAAVLQGIEAQRPQLILTLAAMAIVSSFGMSLPISTPPNAIAMSSGVLRSHDLLKAGLTIGLIGLGLTMLLTQFLWPLMIK